MHLPPRRCSPQGWVDGLSKALAGIKLDGKGGFMAMLHPNETVNDHSKGQSGGLEMNFNITMRVKMPAIQGTPR